MPLAPVASAVFLLSALSYYHVQMPGAAADGPIQAVVLGIYLFFGYVPAIMLSLMVLIWSSIWFVQGSIERPWSRVARIIGFTLSLALVVNVAPSGAQVSDANGLLGQWMAVPLDQAFGGALSTLIAAAAALASLMLATDFLFYRYFDSLARGTTTMATKSAAAGLDTQGVENLAVDELRELDLSFTDPSATASVTSVGPLRTVTTRERNGALEDPEDEIDIALAAADPSTGDDEAMNEPGSASAVPVTGDDSVAPRSAVFVDAAEVDLAAADESVSKAELEADEEIEDEEELEEDEEEVEDEDESEEDEEESEEYEEDEDEEEEEEESEESEEDEDEDEEESEEDEEAEEDEAEDEETAEVGAATEMVFPRGALFPYRESKKATDGSAPDDSGPEQLAAESALPAAAVLPPELQSDDDGPGLTEADLLSGLGIAGSTTHTDPWVAPAAEDDLEIDSDEAEEDVADQAGEEFAEDPGEDDEDVVHPSEVTFGYVDEPIFELPRPEASGETEPDSEPDEKPVIDGDSPYQAELFSSTEFDAKVLRVAADLVVKNRRATATFLQRRLRIGYDDAVKLLDGLREEGIVSGEIGSPKGSLLVDPEAWTAD